MSSSRIRLARAAWLVAIGALSSCGFHLQGAVEMPRDLRSVYVATRDELTPFAIEFRDALKDNGLAEAPRASTADAVVRIGRDDYGRKVLSVSARNTPAEYEIYYRVEYTIDRGGQEVVPTQRLELTRNFSFDEELLLAKQNEEEILRSAMARDLAQLVLRKIGSL